MDQSNAIRRTAISFSLAMIFALLSLFIQNSNHSLIEKDTVEASLGKPLGPMLSK